MSKKITTEDFIRRSKIVHGDIYDYSKSIYIGSSKKLEIVCRKHGSFWQSPGNHYSGKGCNKCAEIKRTLYKRQSFQTIEDRIKLVHGDKYNLVDVIYQAGKYKNLTEVVVSCNFHGKMQVNLTNLLKGHGCKKCAIENWTLTTKDFIEKCKIAHANKYDYSKTVYTKSKDSIEIICPQHGSFTTEAGSHLYHKTGCPICAQDPKRLSLEEFLVKATKIHRYRYDYSQVNFLSSSEKVAIICKIHGSFLQVVNNHLQGQGCPLCADDYKRLKDDEFINRASTLHKNKYDYSKAIYTRYHSKIEIICPTHGSFFQTPASHLNGNGCPKCFSSKGEEKIKDYLEEKKYFCEFQHRIKECKNKRPLPFDFAVFEDEKKTKLKCLIEYDGEQHYKICKNFKMTQKDLIEVQRRDKIKTDYCLKNNIKLIRIPYWEKDNVEDYLRRKDV
jgi:hypothetical protein